MPDNLTHTFTFMGTGAGCGVPAFFCNCPACQVSFLALAAETAAQ